jgi:predicted HicB family RNase H-like nuclease
MLKRVMIQLDEADHDAASTVARSEGLSFAALVRRLIKLYLRKTKNSLETSPRPARKARAKK